MERRKEREIRELLDGCPVIAAVKDAESLERGIHSDIPLVFVLFGDICSIEEIVEKLKEAGKTVFVHLDLIQGLSGREVAVDFLKARTKADGIISTKINVVNYAEQQGFYTVFRVFLVDTKAYETLVKQRKQIHMDVLEILPGVMPRVIKKLVQSFPIPVIASGLIMEKEDVIEGLKAGAMAISTTNIKVWEM
ncbi:MAG TPA: glycerol-3-phosphate responsive antiterminator [Candidatus Blautia faecavium]|uniref:Glycerol-3-phosphate responsive antiterminator n=2 Tax=Candidatus Blautia faecavium TaxID=2838487 RepID=A0A9D2LSD5_9FIRM|nr:glycerol-3-phosphate responsive antiterminator [Candidatus Blautia faecavium]